MKREPWVSTHALSFSLYQMEAANLIQYKGTQRVITNKRNEAIGNSSGIITGAIAGARIGAGYGLAGGPGGANIGGIIGGLTANEIRYRTHRHSN